MMPAESYSYLSSRLVKEVFQLGGRVRDLVPPVVERRLREKYGAAPTPPAAPMKRAEARDDGDGSAVDLSRRALRARGLAHGGGGRSGRRPCGPRGETVLDFSVGEPDQPTPRAHRGRGAWPRSRPAGRATPRPRASPSCAPRWPRATARTSRSRSRPSEVAITIGGKQALYLACQALLDRGDEVIIPSPHWPTFSEAVRLAGGAAGPGARPRRRTASGHGAADQQGHHARAPRR